MPSQCVIDFVNIYGSITSLILGIVAILTSFYFAFLASRSERRTLELISRLEEQVNTLRTVNENLLARTVQHITDTNKQLIKGALNAVNPANFNPPRE